MSSPLFILRSGNGMQCNAMEWILDPKVSVQCVRHYGWRLLCWVIGSVYQAILKPTRQCVMSVLPLSLCPVCGLDMVGCGSGRTFCHAFLVRRLDRGYSKKMVPGGELDGIRPVTNLLPHQKTLHLHMPVGSKDIRQAH